MSNSTDKIIFIGSSTGGVETAMQIYKDLPSNIPAIIMVQHMPPKFTKLYADRINSTCAFNAKEAENGDIIRPGTLYLAPGGYQMSIIKSGSMLKIKIDDIGKQNGYLPSVSYTLDSLLKSIDNKLIIGIMLTGMGNDGAKEFATLAKNGGYTIGEDEASCVVYSMPNSAKKLGGIKKELPLNQIATTLKRDLLHLI